MTRKPGEEQDRQPEADPDAGAAPDTGAGADVGRDAGPDVGRGADADLGRDAGPDVGRGADADLGRDAGADMGRDARADVGRDASADVGRDAAFPSASDAPGRSDADTAEGAVPAGSALPTPSLARPHRVPDAAGGRAPRPSGMALAAARSDTGAPGGDAGRSSLIFVALMAALGATNAVAVDIVIPAQGLIAQSFQLAPGEGAQWTVLAMFAGAAVSQLVLGPAADAWGRRRAAFLGLALAFIGGLAAAAAPTFETLIAARLLQGLGAGGLRVVGLAIIRDQCSGDRMARVVSLQALIFELIMFFTPVVGQLIVEFAHWRLGLALTAVQAVATAIAFHLLQPETLDPAHRRPLAFRAVLSTYAGVLRMRPAMGAAMAMAVSFGVLATFLSSAQPIFGEVYGLGWGLPAVFGGMTAFFVLAAIVNARLVVRLGAPRMARIGLSSWAVSGTAGLIVFALAFEGVPPLWLLLVWLSPTLSMFAILYGNLLATALAPLGDRAGSASSALAASGTLAGVALGAIMSGIFNGTVLPLAGMLGFAGFAGLAAMRWGGLGREPRERGEA